MIALMINIYLYGNGKYQMQFLDLYDQFLNLKPVKCYVPCVTTDCMRVSMMNMKK